MAGNAIDRSGERHCNYSVLGRDGAGKRAIWVCECDEGHQFIRRAYLLGLPCPVCSKRRRFTDPLDKKTLQSLVEERRTLKQISKELGRSVTTVRYWLSLHGLRTDSRRQATKRQCPCCGKTNPRPNSKYCSAVCSFKARNDKLYDEWISGRLPKIGSRALKNVLIRRDGHRCSGCSGVTWRGKPIPLEADHVNGNGDDNRPENTRLLCPNCHAQTETYKAKNRGNGRFARRLQRNKMREKHGFAL